MEKYTIFSQGLLVAVLYHMLFLSRGIVDVETEFFSEDFLSMMAEKLRLKSLFNLWCWNN